MKKTCLALTLVLVMLTMVSCIGIQDGDEPRNASPTLGKELIDLKRAKEAGAITYEEYRALKTQLMADYQ